MTTESLPHDMWGIIMSKLSFNDLMNMSEVNKLTNSVFNNKTFCIDKSMKDLDIRPDFFRKLTVGTGAQIYYVFFTNKLISEVLKLIYDFVSNIFSRKITLLEINNYIVKIHTLYTKLHKSAKEEIDNINILRILRIPQELENKQVNLKNMWTKIRIGNGKFLFNPHFPHAKLLDTLYCAKPSFRNQSLFLVRNTVLVHLAKIRMMDNFDVNSLNFALANNSHFE